MDIDITNQNTTIPEQLCRNTCIWPASGTHPCSADPCWAVCRAMDRGCRSSDIAWSILLVRTYIHGSQLTRIDSLVCMGRPVKFRWQGCWSGGLLSATNSALFQSKLNQPLLSFSPKRHPIVRCAAHPARNMFTIYFCENFYSQFVPGAPHAVLKVCLVSVVFDKPKMGLLKVERRM